MASKENLPAGTGTSDLNLAVRSPYFANQYSHNRIIRDLEKGLNGLRGVNDIASVQVGKATPYLPRFKDEPEEFYLNRVLRSYLTNYYLRTVSSDAGKILANNVIVDIDGKSNDQIEGDFADYLHDMSMLDEDIGMLAQSQMKKAMRKGLTIAMVDFNDEENRPFIREIDIDNVLAFRANKKTGKLNYLRFATKIITDSDNENPDGSVSSECVFEITPTDWSLSNDDGLIDSGEIRRFKNGRKRITDELPISVMYTNKQGMLLGESPYQTLAELTIEHFQVYSDIKNMMFYALTPILAAVGVPTDFSIQALASYMLVTIPNTGEVPAEMKWIQVDSAGLEAGQKQLEGIERRIATFSIDTNALRPGTLTATQASIEGAGTNAALVAFATTLSKHMTTILEMMGSYTLNPPKKIKVFVEPEFNSQETDKEMRVLMEMRRNGDVSRETVVQAAIARKLLPADFDVDADSAKIDKELDDLEKREIAKEKQMSKFNKAAQASNKTLSGSGKEEITDKPRDA